MFHLTTDAVDGIPVLRLANGSGAEAVFAPTLGARLLRLRLLAGGQLLTVLDTGTSASDLANIRSASAVLAPWPNRIDAGAYTWDGQAHQLAISEPARITAIHGLVANVPWLRVSDPAGGIEDGLLAFEHAYNGAAPGYPFAFRIRLLYHLQADHLSMTWLVRNEGHQDMPLGVGWHPYFQLGTPIDELELRLPATHEYAVNNRLIPTDRVPYEGPFRILRKLGGATFDTCFHLGPEGDFGGDGVAEVLLHNPATGRTLELTQPVGAFPCLQIYTPADRKSIALEPMSCPPDVYNQPINLIRLAPNDTWRAAFRVALK